MGFYTETRLCVFAEKKSYYIQPVSVSEDTDDVYKGPQGPENIQDTDQMR